MLRGIWHLLMSTGASFQASRGSCWLGVFLRDGTGSRLYLRRTVLRDASILVVIMGDVRGGIPVGWRRGRKGENAVKLGEDMGNFRVKSGKSLDEVKFAFIIAGRNSEKRGN